MNNINYNQYLFAELLKSYSEYFRTMEYDMFFERIPSMYDQFFNSGYNNEMKGEYVCIEEFLQWRLKPQVMTVEEISERVRTEDLSFITGIDYNKLLKGNYPTAVMVTGEYILEFGLDETLTEF
jgi:hypothetical protein